MEGNAKAEQDSLTQAEEEDTSVQAFCADSCRQRMRPHRTAWSVCVGPDDHQADALLAELEISMHKSSKIRPELAQTNDKWAIQNELATSGMSRAYRAYQIANFNAPQDEHPRQSGPPAEAQSAAEQSESSASSCTRKASARNRAPQDGACSQDSFSELLPSSEALATWRGRFVECRVQLEDLESSFVTTPLM
eukprot:scaffold67435_cov100-Phaeocystis_antarctica.AAC.6